MDTRWEKMQVGTQKKRNPAKNSDKSLSKVAAEKFLAEVKARRYDAAYLLTSQDYRKGTTKKEFQDYVTKHYDALTGFGPVTEDAFATDTGTTYTVTKKAQVA